MIFDSLTQINLYRTIHPLLHQGLTELASGRLANLPDGRHELAGDRLFALVQTYTTKPRAQGRMETHRKYVDIQAILTGAELCEVAPLSEMTPATPPDTPPVPYDPAKDIAFHHGSGDPLTLRPGLFAIFFPADAHMPSLALPTGPAQVRKIVLKVLWGS